MINREAVDKWLAHSLQHIRSKGLKTPIKLNAATTIHDLERELLHIQKAVQHTESEKVLQLFIYKINELKNLKNDHQSQRDNSSQL